MLSIKDLITSSFDLYKRNTGALIKIILLLWAVIFLSAVISAQSLALLNGTWQGYALSFLLQVPFGLISILLSVALILQIAAVSLGQPLNLKNLFFLSVKKYPYALLASVVVGTLTILGFFALVAPGVYLWVAWSFAIYFVILENQKLKESLRSSRELSRGRFWPVFTHLLIPNLFWGFTAWLMQNIFDQAYSLTGLLKLAQQSINWSIVLNLTAGVINGGINAFFLPLFTIVVYLLYKDLKQ